jgi:hypothetical protein
MSELLQFIIVAAFGAFCFGCGYLTAFIVARNQWRDEMIKRGVARYNWQTGKWVTRHEHPRANQKATYFEQRRRIIRKWVGLRATFAPGRIRSHNLPKLPNGRKWRTDLSTALLWSFQGGTLTYEYRNIPMLKQPFEVALYMRLIWETKPGTTIEIGTSSGVPPCGCRTS